MAFGEKKSFFGRLKEGLTKTKDNMVQERLKMLSFSGRKSMKI